MKWFDITDPAKNQMEKLLEKHPGNYAVAFLFLEADVQDLNMTGDLLKIKKT